MTSSNGKNEKFGLGQNRQMRAGPMQNLKNIRNSNGPVQISVTNLPEEALEKHIWSMFGPFGAVTSVSISPAMTHQTDSSMTHSNCSMSHPTRKRTFTATVAMPVYEEAIFAIMGLSQSRIQLFGNDLRVQFKASSPDDSLPMQSTSGLFNQSDYYC